MNHSGQQTIVIIAGATGNLGSRIIKTLAKKDVEIRGFVRSTTSSEKITDLK